jgi:diguanylate cyclase
MPEFNSPSEIARETLRRLAVERVPPTPDNYRTLYFRIAGAPPEEDVFPEHAFKRILGKLPTATPTQLRFSHQLDKAIRQKRWPPLARAILELSEGAQAPQQNWGNLLSQLLEQFERRHADLTTARKREALLHVLQSSGSDATTLHARLSGLVGSWVNGSDGERQGIEIAPTVPAPAPEARDTAPTGAIPTDTAAGTRADTALAPQLGRELSTMMHRGVAAFVSDNADLSQAVNLVADRLGAGPSCAELPELSARLSELGLKLEWAGEDQGSIRHSLVALLQLMVENISQLVIDDQWLTGQLAMIHQVFAQPLDIRSLDEVERRLREVIDQQGRLKKELSDAQLRLKQMLAGFIDRLADMSESAGSFHDTLATCAGQIEQAEDINQLSDVVERLLRETRAAQATAERSRADLRSLRDQVDFANAEIAKLQHELHHTSELVRHDPLTGTLNRKGLDEALRREIALIQRRPGVLCVGLLDVDNFKRINDTHGHHAGDAALQHLSEVIRENLRPQDSLGRYGGEEFLIILPDTDVEHALSAMQRLQRALTSRYFLTAGQKLLITFSAGVARVAPDEPPEDAIDRADKAMYRAKRAGKNRVMMA